MNCCTLQCMSVTLLIKTASTKCIGLYPYTFGHQKQRVSFCCKSRLDCWEHNYRSFMLRKLSWYPGKRDPSSAALIGSWVPHRHEAGRALALTGGAQRVILILRNRHFAPLPPKEAGVQVPNSCIVRPQHCDTCCCHPPPGTCTQHVHQLLPRPSSSALLQSDKRKTNEP